MEKLNITPIDYAAMGGEKPDPILEDRVRLERAAAAFEAHQEAIRDVLQVMMNERARYLVQDAPPDELLPVRHEIAALEAAFDRFATYHAEHERRKPKPSQAPAL